MPKRSLRGFQLVSNAVAVKVKGLGTVDVVGQVTRIWSRERNTALEAAHRNVRQAVVVLLKLPPVCLRVEINLLVLTFAAFSELLLQQLGLCLTARIPFSQQLQFEILVAIRQIGYVFRVPNSQLCNLSLQLLQSQRSRHNNWFSGRVPLDFLHCGYFGIRVSCRHMSRQLLLCQHRGLMTYSR